MEEPVVVGKILLYGFSMGDIWTTTKFFLIIFFENHNYIAMSKEKVKKYPFLVALMSCRHDATRYRLIQYIFIFIF